MPNPLSADIRARFEMLFAEGLSLEQFIRNHTGDAPAHGFPTNDQRAINLEFCNSQQVLVIGPI